RIIVRANSENTCVNAASGLNQAMKVLKVIVISSQEHQVIFDGMQEMPWIGCSAQRNICRRHNVMPFFLQPGEQGGLGGIIIDVEFHVLVASALGAYGHLSRPALLIAASSRALSASSSSLFLVQ